MVYARKRNVRREYTRGSARQGESRWLISRAICQIICPFSPPKDPASFPLLQTERLTFIVNSTPNVRTWHFEYLELNCKHRSTTDGWRPATRTVSMILLFIGSLLTHGATCLWICMCTRPAVYVRASLLPRLAFVSRDLEGYFLCLPLYLLNLLARPDFRNLSFRCSAVNDTTWTGIWLWFSIDMILMYDRSLKICTSCLWIMMYDCYIVSLLQIDTDSNRLVLECTCIQVFSHLNTLLLFFNSIPWSIRFSNLFSLYLLKTRRTLRNNETWTRSSLLLVNPPDIFSETESLDNHDINCANSLWWLCNCR